MAPSPALHVLLCTNSLWNVANFRLRLIERLEAEGYRVTVAAPPDARWAERLRTPSRRVLSLPMRADGLSPRQEAALLGRLVHLLRAERPDVLLSFTPKPNIYGGLAARVTGVAAVPNVSGLGTAFLGRPVLRQLVSLLYRAAFRAAPRVFFQNAEDLAWFVDHGLVEPARATLLPGSGVDLERFALRPPREPDGTTRFLFLGRLLGDKGVRELVEAARIIRARHPQARFQLLGFADAANRTAITRDELNSWLAEEVVEYLGAAEDVRPALAAADAVVLPSYREGLPRSLLEAAAMGRPLIATDVPGNRSIVEDGRNGLLCEVRSATSLAAAIERFRALSPEGRADMGRRAREKVVAEFSEEKVFRAYLDLLAELTRPKVR